MSVQEETRKMRTYLALLVVQVSNNLLCACRRWEKTLIAPSVGVTWSRAAFRLISLRLSYGTLFPTIFPENLRGTIKPCSRESLNSGHANPSPGSVSVIARPRLLFPERLEERTERENRREPGQKVYNIVTPESRVYLSATFGAARWEFAYPASWDTQFES